jgi:hypothetical protein
METKQRKTPLKHHYSRLTSIKSIIQVVVIISLLVFSQSSGVLASNTVNKAVTAYGFVEFSRIDCSFIASHFALLNTEFYEDVSSLQYMKDNNPGLKILGYKDLIGMQSYYDDWKMVNGHEDWFVHDANGSRIINKKFGWFLMDVNYSGWRQYWVDYINGKFGSFFDGVFADDCWNTISNYWDLFNSSIPDDVVLGWHNATVGMLQYAKANLAHGKILIVNSGEVDSDDYLNIADGQMIEGYYHASWHISDFYANNGNSLIDTLARKSSLGKLIWCDCGTVVPSPYNETLMNNMLKYTYSAFLLGINGSQAYWSFNNWNSADNSKGYYSIADTDMGASVGPYYSSQGILLRDFSKGKALVNPSAGSFVINLGDTYYFPNGTSVTNLTMGAYNGELLFNFDPSSLLPTPTPVQITAVNPSSPIPTPISTVNPTSSLTSSPTPTGTPTNSPSVSPSPTSTSQTPTIPMFLSITILIVLLAITTTAMLYFNRKRTLRKISTKNYFLDF